LILADERLNQKHWSDLRVDASPFRSVFEYAAIGMVLADTDGRCLAANRAFCEMVGYTEDELLKLELARLTHPDDLPENLRLGRQLLAGEIDSFKYEKRYYHRQAADLGLQRLARARRLRTSTLCHLADSGHHRTQAG
jgi:PAS domain-containing protein